MIYISQAAAREIKRVQLSRQQPDSLFRLTVKNGGCSGLLYSLELETQSLVSNFTQKDISKDIVHESNGIKVIIDVKTASYLNNLQLDYSEDLMGGGFRFQNSNATNCCSCGLSFSVDLD
jgi:iron-sulfur cluster assembly accessory protein